MRWREHACPLPVLCDQCVVLGRAWGFIHSSFPVMQLQSESGRNFWCGGILGNWKGLGLKAAQGFVHWTLLKARGRSPVPPSDLELCPTCFPCMFGMLGVPSHCLQHRLWGACV